ncbi:MAG: 30S ribosomal protein S18 [Bdellovibrio sp.]
MREFGKESSFNRETSREHSRDMGREGGRDSGKLGGRRPSRKDFEIDYKDPMALGRYVSDGGKIVPARLSKFRLKEQKKVAEAVKKARNIALIPNGTAAYDSIHRPESISPAPFEY